MLLHSGSYLRYNESLDRLGRLFRKLFIMIICKRDIFYSRYQMLTSNDAQITSNHIQILRVSYLI
jgi:hypothetical protein